MQKLWCTALCFSVIPILNVHTEIIWVAQLCVSNITYANALQAQQQTLPGRRPDDSTSYWTQNQFFLSSVTLFLYSMNI